MIGFLLLFSLAAFDDRKGLKHTSESNMGMVSTNPPVTVEVTWLQLAMTVGLGDFRS